MLNINLEGGSLLEKILYFSFENNSNIIFLIVPYWKEAFNNRKKVEFTAKHTVYGFMILV